MLCLSGFELYSRWVPLIMLEVMLKFLISSKKEKAFNSRTWTWTSMS